MYNCEYAVYVYYHPNGAQEQAPQGPKNASQAKPEDNCIAI